MLPIVLRLCQPFVVFRPHDLMRSSGISCRLSAPCPLRNSFPQRFLAFSAALSSQITHPVCVLLPGIRFFSAKIMTVFRNIFILPCTPINYKVTAFYCIFGLYDYFFTLSGFPPHDTAVLFRKKSRFPFVFSPARATLLPCTKQQPAARATRL